MNASTGCAPARAPTRSAREDRAHHRDPERAADLAERVQHPGADARLVDGHRAQRCGRHRRHRDRHPDAAEEHRRQERPVRRVRPAAARRGAASRPTSVIPPAISQRDPSRSEALPATGATRMIRSVIGRNARPGAHGAVAEHVLHVQRDEEEDAEHRERDEERDRVRPANVGLRNSVMSNIGRRWCSSSSTNATPETAASAKRPRISGEVQP